MPKCGEGFGLRGLGLGLGHNRFIPETINNTPLHHFTTSTLDTQDSSGPKPLVQPEQTPRWDDTPKHNDFLNAFGALNPPCRSFHILLAIAARLYCKNSEPDFDISLLLGHSSSLYPQGTCLFLTVDPANTLLLAATMTRLLSATLKHNGLSFVA
jgi:hypothetical protein